MDDQVTPFEQTQQFHDVLSAAHEFLLNRIEDQHLDVASWSHETAAKYVSIETATFVQEWRIPVNESEMHKVAVALVKEVTGFGPLDDLLADGEVEDILVNGYENVYASRHGILQREPVRFSDNRHVVRIVRRILAPLGRRLDEANPMVDARLANGGRLNAIIEPLSVTGPTVSIRKFRQDPFTPEQLVGNGTFDRSIHALLQAAVASRCNILISGGTSSGKTSLLNALASFIPDAERVITIEDTAELSLSHPHVVRLESRLGGFDGGGAVGIRELVRNSLRMRPDRIVVGEVRGAEVLEMLQAMNTGHDGSITTLHANTTRDALARLETMVSMANLNLPEKAMRQQIASAINVVIQVARLSDGTRKVVSITELVGMEGDVITMQDIFVYDRQGMDGDKVVGQFRATGIRPRFAERLKSYGIDLSSLLFSNMDGTDGRQKGPGRW
jgi:pilus assembly protein CpaF